MNFPSRRGNRGKLYTCTLESCFFTSDVEELSHHTSRQTNWEAALSQGSRCPGGEQVGMANSLLSCMRKSTASSSSALIIYLGTHQTTPTWLYLVWKWSISKLGWAQPGWGWGMCPVRDWLCFPTVWLLPAKQGKLYSRERLKGFPCSWCFTVVTWEMQTFKAVKHLE